MERVVQNKNYKNGGIHITNNKRRENMMKRVLAFVLGFVTAEIMIRIVNHIKKEGIRGKL